MNYKKFISACCVFFSFMAVSFAEAPRDPFDIASEFEDTQGHWAYDYIKYLRLSGIVHGKDVGTFAPDGYITRAELTKIALEAFLPEVEYNPEDKRSFPDVNDFAWYAPYVRQAKDLLIVNGYDDGSFRPDNNISKAEALKVLLETGEFGVPLHWESVFDDVVSSDWYHNHVNFAAWQGVIDVPENKLFLPNEPATRAEIAQFAAKLVKVKERSQFESNAEIFILGEVDSETLNEKYGLSYDNLWKRYVNFDYGFSFYFPALREQWDDDFYPLTVFEENNKLYVDVNPVKDWHESYVDGAFYYEIVENNISRIVEGSYPPPMYFGRASNQEEVDQLIKEQVSEDCKVVFEGDGPIEGRFFIEAEDETNIDDSQMCGNKGAYYNSWTDTVFYYQKIAGSVEYRLKGPEGFVAVTGIYPYELEFFDPLEFYTKDYVSKNQLTFKTPEGWEILEKPNRDYISISFGSKITTESLVSLSVFDAFDVLIDNPVYSEPLGDLDDYLQDYLPGSGTTTEFVSKNGIEFLRWTEGSGALYENGVYIYAFIYTLNDEEHFVAISPISAITEAAIVNLIDTIVLPFSEAPDSFIEKSDEFIISKVGEDFFDKYISYSESAYIPVDEFCIEKPKFCSDYSLSPYYSMNYSFNMLEIPYVEGDMIFLVDINGDLILEADSFGIPDCVSDPKECEFLIDEAQAMDIVKGVGFAEGLEEWTASFYWSGDNFNTYVWGISNVLSYNEPFDGASSGKRLSVDANSGEFLEILEWMTIE